MANDPATRASTPRRSRRRDSGQSIVEFALVVPLMVILLFAIIDFARIYTTMVSVESAAREAADFGTTLGASRWQDGVPKDDTVAEMEARACVAASDLTGYADPDDDPSNGGCTNPTFDYCLTTTTGGSCLPFDPAAGCDDPLRATPCRVTVTLGYDFELLAPLRIDLLGVELGLPTSIALERSSTFAMTDIDLAAPAP
jgi:Flp pilus assembly protein TadG